jgi:hypothetical protein
MNREQFLADTEVIKFVNWASVYLHSVQVDLNISRRGTGRALKTLGPGVRGQFVGVDQIVKAYHWRSSWTDPAHIVTESGDWPSTRRTLAALSAWLQREVAAGNCAGARSAAREVIQWGGDRKPEVGATRFLDNIPNLPAYLMGAAGDLSLGNGDEGVTPNVAEMNAMLTKVHAMAANDGLPIYDSRVAATIASLVEIYRQNLTNPWTILPRTLHFMAVDRTPRRRTLGLEVCSTWPTPVIDPGVITRETTVNAIRKRAEQWSSSKMRLGWLMEEIIGAARRRNVPLFNDDTVTGPGLPSEMHALEAALFMIGFDVGCLQCR